MLIDTTLLNKFTLRVEELRVGECYERVCDDRKREFVLVTHDEYVVLSTGRLYRLKDETPFARFRHLPNAAFRPEG